MSCPGLAVGWQRALECPAAYNDMMEIQKNVRVLGWQLAGEHIIISAGEKLRGVLYDGKK